MSELIVKPNSRPQEEFFAGTEDEILYGGAAGGGKTFSLVVDPMRYIHLSNFTGIIFRRTFPELEGSVIPISHKIYYAAGATYHEGKKLYTFPSGATIRLGVMQHRDDWQNYQGSPYAYQGYDELTNFLEMQYTMMSIWNRSIQDGVLAYRRAASNPLGIGHNWVKKRFYDVCKPIPDGEKIYSELARMWWQPMRAGKTYVYREKDTETGREVVRTRKFVPSRVFDNVDLLKTNPGYLDALLSLPVQKRKAYFEGSWDVFEGQFFSEWSPEIHIVHPQHYLSYTDISKFKIASALDYGTTSACGFLYKDWYGNVYLFDNWHDEGSTRDKKAESLSRFIKVRSLNKFLMLGDTNLWLKDGFDVQKSEMPANAFKEQFKKDGLDIKFEMVNKTIKGEPSVSIQNNRGYRVLCNDAIKNALHYEVGEDGNYIIRPKFYVYERCTHFINTFPGLIADPDDVEDIADGQEDHDFDAVKMGFMAIRTPRKSEEKKVFEWQKRLQQEEKSKIGFMGK